MNIVHLYCPICGGKILYNSRVYGDAMHHREFGIVCNEVCLAAANLKYARMILDKGSETPAEEKKA